MKVLNSPIDIKASKTEPLMSLPLPWGLLKLLGTPFTPLCWLGVGGKDRASLAVDKAGVFIPDCDQLKGYTRENNTMYAKICVIRTMQHI